MIRKIPGRVRALLRNSSISAPRKCSAFTRSRAFVKCPQSRKNSHLRASTQWLFITRFHALISLLTRRLLNDSSNTTVNITICIVLNISSDILFCKMIHFVIIISISNVFQVQNKPMGFLPPIQMKGLITMNLIHAEYNPMHNSIDINHYNGYILRIDCNQAESGIRTTPNSQRCLNALAIDNPLECTRLALDGEMQA